ncbi:MAG: ORF6N domain-containing protein [Coprobacillus sp.]
MDKENNNIRKQEQNKVSIVVMDKADNEIIEHEYTDTDIQAMIYEIRGQQVMLDSDLAKLFNYKLKRLNEQVKNNMKRFPDDFMFQLTYEENEKILRSKNSTSSKHGGRRYLPYVFTEQGVNQLSAVLKGSIAEKQSVLIMRTFVKMRHYLIENKQLLGNTDILKITHSLIEDNIKIKEGINKNYKESKKDIMEVKSEIKSIKENIITKGDMRNTMDKILDSFIPKEDLKQFVFKDGQPFEANVAYKDIYKEAKHSIYIVDDYINYHTLSLLTAKNNGVDVIIFSDNKGRGSEKLNELEFNNFNREYPILSIKRNNSKCHDRFIILDYNSHKEKIYHCGASSKDAGNKVCCISPFSTSNIINSIVDALLENDDYIF